MDCWLVEVSVCRFLLHDIYVLELAEMESPSMFSALALLFLFWTVYIIKSEGQESLAYADDIATL